LKIDTLSNRLNAGIGHIEEMPFLNVLIPRKTLEGLTSGSFSQRLTWPRGRKYITSVLERGNHRPDREFAARCVSNLTMAEALADYSNSSSKYPFANIQSVFLNTIIGHEEE
jgi:hypothetical protein